MVFLYGPTCLAATRHQLLQRDARVAVLVNSSNPQIRLALADVQAAAAATGRPFEIVTATTNREITPAFKEAVQKRADAILISPIGCSSAVRCNWATLAARHAMPAIYALREFAEAGGLISYGSNFTDMIRQAGTYVGRILKSEKSADLPILQATISSSICRPPRRSASMCRRRCSRLPTR